MELWEISARESIRDLTTRYNSNGDAGRFANVRELFHDDAVMDLEGVVKTGLDEIITIFTGTQSKLHNVNVKADEVPMETPIRERRKKEQRYPTSATSLPLTRSIWLTSTTPRAVCTSSS